MFSRGLLQLFHPLFSARKPHDGLCIFDSSSGLYATVQCNCHGDRNFQVMLQRCGQNLQSIEKIITGKSHCSEHTILEVIEGETYWMTVFQEDGLLHMDVYFSTVITILTVPTKSIPNYNSKFKLAQ